MRVLSLGAGVQSTVMALMVEEGELPMVDCAIFSDTGWEPLGVYEHLDWLESKLSYPVYRVSIGNIREDSINSFNTTGQRFASIPFFTSNGGMLRRQCTAEYKINPIRRKIRELLGVKKGKRVPKGECTTQLIGISTDEASRMKPSQDKWIQNTWPLVEKLMSRQDCIKWFKKRYPDRKLSKSACIGCPYRDDKGWREMKMNDPVSFKSAVEFDKKIRGSGSDKVIYDLYIHKTMKPLDEIDFRSLEDMGQINMFEEECEGMCGV